MRLEQLAFGHRGFLLGLLGVFTVDGTVREPARDGRRLRHRQLPQDHEYVRTFFEYRDQVFGANRVIVVVRARDGEIWSAPGLRRLLTSRSR
ncbi:MAG: hypothetical protein U1F11_15590 [Steroidobacteraceae bacterium]